MKIAIMAACALLVGCNGRRGTGDGLFADITTSRGIIVLKLDYQRAPLMTMQFVGLAEGKLFNTFHRPGEPFYDGLGFHRADKAYVKTGAPHGDERRDAGYLLPDQFIPGFSHDKPGIVSMARTGMQYVGSTGLGMSEPNTVGPQFFITRAPAPELDACSSPFGRVVRGMDALNALGVGDRILFVSIRRVGRSADAFVVDQAAFEKLRR